VKPAKWCTTAATIAVDIDLWGTVDVSGLVGITPFVDLPYIAASAGA